MKVQAGLHPQPDYLALADRLHATLITPVKPGAQPRRAWGKAFSFIRIAWAAFRRRQEFDVIISDVDHVGLVLAILLKVTKSSQHHVVICHGKLPQRADSLFIKLLRLHTHLHRVVCYGPRAADALKSQIPEMRDRTTVIWHAPDHRFWQPIGRTPERLIVSAGLLRRDYRTLIEAVRGLDVAVEVAAHSPWVAGNAGVHHASALPPNVRFQRHDYPGLRQLYGRALMVAVPLMPSHAQAGSLVVYEAMAMGKPVIVTNTPGQASMGLIEEGETGYYVDPGDVERWRVLIKYLLDYPEDAAAMGRRARQKVETTLNLDAYTDQMERMLLTDVSSQTKEDRSHMPLPR